MKFLQNLFHTVTNNAINSETALEKKNLRRSNRGGVQGRYDRGHSITALKYVTQLRHSTTALNYGTQLRHSITELKYNTELWHSFMALNYGTQIRHSITAPNYDT